MILLVDDDRDFVEIYKQILELNGFEVLAASNGKAALDVLRKHDVSVVISDIVMPNMDGLALLKKVKGENPNVEVIMLTAEGSVDGAVEAMHLGAATYLEKPVNIDDLIMKTRRAKQVHAVHRENEQLKAHLEDVREVSRLIGESEAVKSVHEMIDIVSESDATVLVTGESGTGKEIVASEIHYKSGRRLQPFVKVNCAALAESVLESELFGHEKGAFTGATALKIGRFEMADHGTIMLDEVGELPLGLQSKLLRVLQEKELERVGGQQTIKVDFRVIAVTNRDLRAEVAAGRFREDLFYRLNVVPIHLVPLGKRKVDIPLLCQHFVDEYSRELKKKVNPLPREVVLAFNQYNWPGNVRELKNLIERLVVLSRDGTIRPDDLPEAMRGSFRGIQTNKCTWKEAKSAFEKHFLEQALERHEGNVTQTADELGISRKSIYEKMKRLGIVAQ